MPISDLTGYTWTGNSVIPLSGVDIDEQWYIDYSIYNPQIGETDSSCFSFDVTEAEDYGGSGRFLGIYVSSAMVSFDAYDSGDGWIDERCRTIQITGGTDATNATLIAWLEANGTLTAPVLANTYELTHSLTNLTHGNVTIQITPDNGYTYPSTLTVTNGTLVSYDNTTGVAVISGDDTTTVSGECVAQPSRYSGNISTYDGQSIGNFTSTAIKFDTPPTSNSDYDAYVDVHGSMTGLTSYQNKTKIYFWSPDVDSYGKVRINNIVYDGRNSGYSNATEMSLTGNYDIELAYSRSGGSND